MSLRFYHGDPPAPELVHAISLGEGNPGLTTVAELGEVGTCQLIIDDPAGTLDIQAQKRLYANEDLETAGDVRVWFGYVGEREIGREGAGAIYTNALGRSWAVDLDDVNAVLAFRIFPTQGTAANRPAETKAARLTWLLGTSQMSAVHDNARGFVDYPSGTVNMDACDYRGQYARDVLGDIAKAIDPPYNFYAYYDEGSANIGLWFNDPNGTAYTSPLSLSNVGSDINLTTTFPPYMDFKLRRSPSRVFSGVDFTFSGGTASGAYYAQSTATAAEFYSRDTSVSEPNVKTLAEATRRATTLLTTMSSEDDRLVGSVELPSEKINDIKAGHRLWVTFSHLGGFEHGEDYASGHWTRVLRRTVRDIENRTQAARILDLELTPITSPPCPDPTPGGYYPPLGPKVGGGAADTPADGVTYYWHTGIPGFIGPTNPGAGYSINGWNFGDYGNVPDAGTSPAGYVDGMPAGWGNVLYLKVVGDGSLEVLFPTRNDETVGWEARQYDANPAHPDEWDFDVSHSLVLRTPAWATSDTFEIRALHPEIPEITCYHLIEIVADDPNFGAVRYGGCNWTPV